MGFGRALLAFLVPQPWDQSLVQDTGKSSACIVCWCIPAVHSIKVDVRLPGSHCWANRYMAESGKKPGEGPFVSPHLLSALSMLMVWQEPRASQSCRPGTQSLPKALLNPSQGRNGTLWLMAELLGSHWVGGLGHLKPLLVSGDRFDSLEYFMSIYERFKMQSHWL